MAYFGTTKSSSLRNPPKCLTPSFASNPGATGFTPTNPNQQLQGGNVWHYNSTNLSTVAMAAGFFTDGYRLGMRSGDVVYIVGGTTAASKQTLAIGVVSAAASTGVTVSTKGAILSTLSA